MFQLISYPGNKQHRASYPTLETALHALLETPDAHDAYVWTPQCRAIEKRQARGELLAHCPY